MNSKNEGLNRGGFFFGLVLLTSLCLSLTACGEAGAGGGGTSDQPDGDDPAVIRPIAFFEIDPDPELEIITTFQEIRFDAQGSYSEESDRTIESYRWDFIYVPAGSFEADEELSVPEVFHIYRRSSSAGHIVALTVTDSAGVESHVFTREVPIKFTDGATLIVE